ncbi:unnamed protein product, partial [Dibothriocephalus latus]
MALYNGQQFQQLDDYPDDSVFQETPPMAVRESQMVQRSYLSQEYGRQKVPANVAYVHPTFYKPGSVHAQDPEKFPVKDEDEFMTYATSTRLRSEYNEYGVIVENNADEYEKKTLQNGLEKYPNDLDIFDQELYLMKQENERLRTLLENRELIQDSYGNENYLYSEEMASNMRRHPKNLDSEICRLQEENRQLRSYLEENRYGFENANDATDYDDDFEEIIEETTTTTRPAPVQAVIPYVEQSHLADLAVIPQRSVGVGDIDVNQFYLLGTGTQSIDPADFPRPFWERISEYFTERYRRETRHQVPQPPVFPPLRSATADRHLSFKNFGSLAPQCPNADADFIRNLYRYSQYDCSAFIRRLVTKLTELRRVTRQDQPRRATVRSESVGVSARPVMADKRTSSMP